MRDISARDAEDGFGLLMAICRVAPGLIRKYGPPLAVFADDEKKELAPLRSLKSDSSCNS